MANVKKVVVNGIVYLFDIDAAQIVADLQSGSLTPLQATNAINALRAKNLESWEGSGQRVPDTQKAAIFTTGGDESIDSSIAAQLQSIKALNGAFSAASLMTSGFNLLRLQSAGGLAVAIGSGWYIPVPALTYSAAGTASTPNGLLLTDAQGVNIKNATVRFKALTSGVPTSENDGSACSYTDVTYDNKSYRFYTCSGPGYIIISGITYANTCAHLGWSSRYDEFISPTATGDSGSSISLSSILSAIHAGYGKLINVGGESDEIVATSASAIKWTRRCNRVAATSLSWTHVQGENNSYTHTATISDMKDNGVAEFENDNVVLTINGQTISFTDNNATVTTSDYIKYQLAAETTGTASVSTALTVEDWGVIAFIGASGTPSVTISYAQGMPDSLRTIAVTRMNEVEEAINAISEYIDTGDIEDNSEMPLMPMLGGQPAVLFCAGAPTAANKPTNWIDCVDGGYQWTGLPAVIGQHVRDITNSADYFGWLNPSTGLLEWK